MVHKIYLAEYGELLVDPNMFENPTAKYLFDMEEGASFYTTNCKVWDEYWIDFDVNPVDFTKEHLLMYFPENFKGDLEYFEERDELDDLEGWDFQLVAHILANEEFLSEEVVETIHITKDEFVEYMRNKT